MNERTAWKLYQWRLRRYGRISERANNVGIQEAIDKGLLQKEWQAWGKVGRAYEKWREAGGHFEATNE